MNNNPGKYPVVSHNGNGNGQITLHHIYETLEKLIQRLEGEIALQQTVIRKQLQEIEALKADIENKENAATNAVKKLEESLQNVEGNRQLINKLVSDIAHYQNDIDWFKRTYEKRSIWGVIKDKLMRDPNFK